MADLRCSNCTDAVAIGHGAADRECPAFLTQHHKIQEQNPENKYKFFPTPSPTTWKLLNKPDSCTGLNQPRYRQENHQQTDTTNLRHQQCFMEDWQTTRCQRGRPAPQNWTQDNRWPVQPTQRTLDHYMMNQQGHGQQEQEGIDQDTTIQRTQWSEQDPNEEGPGPRLILMPPRRDHTSLEYV